MKTTGIILLTEKSIKSGENINKNLESLNNKYKFLYCLKVFNDNPNIDNIILVVRECDKTKVFDILTKIKINKSVNIVLGGNTRMESVYNAIINTNSDIVVIQDIASPIIKSEYIDNGIYFMNNHFGNLVNIPVNIFNREKLVLYIKYKNNFDIINDIASTNQFIKNKL